MRTTIEIPIKLRQKLATEAATRNLKGYSAIIVEALEEYFQENPVLRGKSIAELKGCLSVKELNSERRRIAAGRHNWRK